MQLCGRIGLKLLEFSRCSRKGIIGANGTFWRYPVLVGRRCVCSGRRPHSLLETWQGERFVPFRGFAAPVQAKPKPEAKERQGLRINKAITAPFVRLVTDEGHAVVSKLEALERAMKLKLDLVEVQRTANPPVCKLMDFHKEKYKQQLKEKERMKGKPELLRKGDYKEVRFTIKTELKDLQMKADMVRRLMERGYRVKCMAMGNEDQDLGTLLSRLAALIEDVSFVESGPRVEKRQAYMVVRHAKFGPSKGKSVQKAAKVVKASAGLAQAPASPWRNTDAISSSCPDVEVESESVLETEPEIVSLDDGTEFVAVDVEPVDLELGHRVPWSDLSVPNNSGESFKFENFDVKTDFSSVEEVTASTQDDCLLDAGLFRNDTPNCPTIAEVDNSVSFKAGRGKDPEKLTGPSNIHRASMNSKFMATEGPGKPSSTPILDPILEPLKSMSLIRESRDDILLDRQNHLKERFPQLKHPKEVISQIRFAGPPHDSLTVRRPLHVDQNMAKTIGGSQNVKKPPGEGSGVSGLTNAKHGEPSGLSAPQAGYGIFSALENVTSGDGSSQDGGKMEGGTRSDGTSGRPDSNIININRYRSRPEAESADKRNTGKARQGGWDKRNNGKAGQGGWGMFSRDSSNPNQRGTSTDR